MGCAQLHGTEPPEIVEQLAGRRAFRDQDPFYHVSAMSEADRFPADAFLVECAGGPLPGGNASAWDWSQAKALGAKYPLVIAGGLTPATVCRALQSSFADAVDVSSSGEIQTRTQEPGPGRRIRHRRTCPRAADLPETRNRPRRIFP
ncbi:MAG: hypothetical protein U5K69_28260 [Balneolaceae bacterium]|nr:hypothetical protein [Balneolaceae bacterium]